MKRFLPVAVAICALALPASAAASQSEFRGAAPEPSVGFIAKIVDDEVIQVKKFRFFDIVLDCDGGLQIVVDNNSSPLPKMGVNDNKFGDTFTSNNGQKVKVNGKFSKHGKVAEGTLRITGDFTDQNGQLLTNCDSGKVSWTAK